MIPVALPALLFFPLQYVGNFGNVFILIVCYMIPSYFGLLNIFAFADEACLKLNLLDRCDHKDLQISQNLLPADKERSDNVQDSNTMV